MNENTTAAANEFDLKPCFYCGKQPELIEEPRYFFNCPCSVGLVSEYPSVDLAAEKWNLMNDSSNFADLEDDGWEPCSGESTADDISPSRKLHGYRQFSAVPGLLARLKPCPFCGAQPEILECPNPSDYGYFVRCLCHTADICTETILQRTPEDAIAAWNTRAEPKGIFPALKKRLARFFRPYDLGYFALLFLCLHVPFVLIAKLKEAASGFLPPLIFVSGQSALFSVAVVCGFAALRWVGFDEEETSSL